MSSSSLHSFELTAEQLSKLDNYSSLMMKWNAQIQMTATKQLDEFVDRHILDSLELAADIPSGAGTMVDVGSGGGLPGIVLAIARPDLSLTLIEPTRKKHAFLSTARRELGLKNVQTAALRYEEFIAQEDFERFDYGVARAVWSMEEWLSIASALVRVGGVVFGMEGRVQASLPATARRRSYVLPGDRQRAIITITIEKHS